MLSTFLDKLTSSFFSKYFLIANFFPLLIAAFVNVVLLLLHGGDAAHWITQYPSESASFQAWFGGTVLVALAVLAYLLSGVSGVLRESLEGTNWPELRPVRSLFMNAMRERQRGRLRSLIEERDARDLTFRYIKQNQETTWFRTLADARTAGRQSHPKKSALDKDVVAPTKLVRALEDLVELQTVPMVKEGEDNVIGPVVDAVVQLLSSADANADPRMSKLQSDLKAAIQAIHEMVKREYVRLHIERLTRFGPDLVLPTTVGNIGEGMRSYTMTRYGLSLDTFWPRLQVVIEGESAYFAALQDVKSHFDFLVASFWLSVLAMCAWIIALAAEGRSTIMFPMIAALGPLVAYMFYRLSITAYEAFAETLRTGVDLYRFKLLEALHVVLPRDLEEEQRIWDALYSVAAYGDRVALHLTHTA